jgi:hypothetical protein
MTESSTPLTNKPGSGNTSADIAGQLAAAIVARLMAEHLAHGEASVRFDGSAQRKSRPAGARAALSLQRQLLAGKLAIRPGR